MSPLSLRFRRVATILRAICIAGIVAFILMGAHVLLESLLRGDVNGAGGASDATASTSGLILLTVWTLVATGANIAVLWFTARLFGVYATADPLSETAARLIRSIALALFAKGVISILSPTVFSLIESLSATPGTRRLVISFGDMQAGFLLAAALIWVIGTAMSEAARAAAENRGFV
ncbi:hypothetical protein [Shimia biformata]|uniref:hypothetical protein n=1 Tax=Shimia biformata TaxID=1294299 RepID=UPI00194EE4CA|nr:hypothetical protein [Shimia biformata]